MPLVRSGVIFNQLLEDLAVLPPRRRDLGVAVRQQPQHDVARGLAQRVRLIGRVWQLECVWHLGCVCLIGRVWHLECVWHLGRVHPMMYTR